MQVAIDREYTHATYGRIGSVKLSIDEDGSWTLNGAVLPESGVRHLLNHALQSPQDAYAGAKNTEDATAAFDKKVTRIIDGSIGVRGSGVDPLTRECRAVARELIRAKFRSAGAKYSDFTAKSAEDQLSAVQKVIDSNTEIVEKEAKKRIAAKANVAKLEIDIEI